MSVVRGVRLLVLSTCMVMPLAAWAGGPVAPGDGPAFKLSEPPGMPAYPGATIYSMGQEMRVNGSPMDLYYFVTDRSPPEVAEFYRRVWREKVPPPRSFEGSHLSMVSFYDFYSGYSLAVNALRPPGEEATVVYLSRIKLLGEVKAPEGGEVPLPVMPGALMPLVVSSSELGGRNRLATYTLRGEMDEAVGYLDAEMKARGWKQEYSATSEKVDGAQVRFYRQENGRRATVTLTPRPDLGTVSVVMISGGP